MANLDLAGIITRICTDLRAKFSKVTVTRSLTSGTKSATVTVDGVKYDLYAPSQPFASTTAPLMDGTASYGSGNYYARSNHVHPTDTSRQATLVSGTNIKTINGNSLLGSGSLWIKGLPDVYAADNGKVLMVVDGTWQAVSLPLASDSTFGVVKVDGTTIMSANGVISTDGGGATSYEVTITLTNPRNAGQFSKCEVWQMASSDPFDGGSVKLQDITSPTGSETYEIPATAYGLRVSPRGVSPYGGSASCTGGVTCVSDDGYDFIFSTTGDGTITLDGVNYDD